MRYRLMTIGDVPAVVRLYEQHLRENARPYPRVSDTPDLDFTKYLMAQLTENGERYFGMVAVANASTDGGRVVGGDVYGVITAQLNFRFLEHPQQVGYVEFLAVDPRLRRKGVARALVQRGCAELFRRGAHVLECAYRPGSTAEAMWQTMGIKPFLVWGAWIGPDFQPRTDLPVIPSGIASQADPGHDEPANPVPGDADDGIPEPVSEPRIQHDREPVREPA